MKKIFCAGLAILAFIMITATPADYTGFFKWILWELVWIPVFLYSCVEWEIENERR